MQCHFRLYSRSTHSFLNIRVTEQYIYLTTTNDLYYYLLLKVATVSPRRCVSTTLIQYSQLAISKSETHNCNASRQSYASHQFIQFGSSEWEIACKWGPPSIQKPEEGESEVRLVRPSIASAGNIHPDDCHHLFDGRAQLSFDALLRDASERGTHTYI